MTTPPRSGSSPRPYGPTRTRQRISGGRRSTTRTGGSQALREYSEAIQADPNGAMAFVGRATAYGAEGDLKAMLADYDGRSGSTATSLSPTSGKRRS